MSLAVTSSYLNRATPGVYITEVDAFPSSIVGVATAVPIFVGYTETAKDPVSEQSLYGQSVSIGSMVEYTSRFGESFRENYVVASAKPVRLGAAAFGDFPAFATDGHDQARMEHFVLHSADTGRLVSPRFNLWAALRLFFANGGGNCFVVSVANYWGNQTTTPPRDRPAVSVNADDLESGLAIARATNGPTMLVVPDACLLPEGGDAAGYNRIAVAMLQQAGDLRDRVAILDLPGALDPGSWTPAGLKSAAVAFYGAIAPADGTGSYGAAYAPAVATSLLTVAEVDYSILQGSVASTDTMNMLLTTQAHSLHQATRDSPGFLDLTHKIGAAFRASVVGPQYSAYDPAVFTTPATAGEITALNQSLCAALPMLPQVLGILVDRLNVAPPSGAMAGIWVANDANQGVWNAPANVSVATVVAPMVAVTDQEQGGYNVPVNGHAIDILRSFDNRGTVVWGARTLDGNSLNYRYIQVRRTLIYVEQSIKLALRSYVFAANDAGTWTTVTAVVAHFLTALWQAGGLMGAKPSDAFTVECGVPSTMTGLDVLNGYMIVSVTVQMIHPGEFIALTFSQEMQGA